jgi:hypothetical protein
MVMRDRLGQGDEVGAMDREKIKQAMAAMVRLGTAPSPEEAVAGLVMMIERLDMLSDDYLADMQVLVGAGACIWQLQQT